MDSKDQTKLKELSSKVPEIDEKLNKIIKDLKHMNLDDIKEKLKSLSQIIEMKSDH